MVTEKQQFTPIKKSKRVFEIISKSIKDAILNGDYRSGDRLPSEKELADQFNASRHTIREALSMRC